MQSQLAIILVFDVYETINSKACMPAIDITVTVILSDQTLNFHPRKFSCSVRVVNFIAAPLQLWSSRKRAALLILRRQNSTILIWHVCVAHFTPKFQKASKKLAIDRESGNSVNHYDE